MTMTPNYKRKYELRRKLMNLTMGFVRIMVIVLFFQAVVTGNMFGVTLGVLAFCFDAWTTVKTKQNRELHEQWIAEHEKRLDEVRSCLSDAERAEYDRRLAALMAEFDREHQSRWARWRQARGEG